MKHGWNTWDNYLNVHEKVLKKYQGNFATSNPRYKIEYITENFYTLEIPRLDIITNQGNNISVKIYNDKWPHVSEFIEEIVATF